MLSSKKLLYCSRNL